MSEYSSQEAEERKEKEEKAEKETFVEKEREGKKRHRKFIALLENENEPYCVSLPLLPYTHTQGEETRLPTDFFFSRHTAARKKGIEPLFSPPLFPQREMMFFVVRNEKEGRECKQGGRGQEKDFFPTLRDWCCYRVWVFSSSFCPFYRKG